MYRKIICQLFFTIFLLLNINTRDSLAEDRPSDNAYNFSNNITDLLDTVTPFGVKLSPRYRRSHAFETTTRRMPETLARTIDLLNVERREIIENYGESSGAELDQVIERIGDLKNEIIANEHIKPLVNTSHSSDSKIIDVWNNYLIERTVIEGGIPKWYSTIFIYNEPYMYQRIAQAFRLTETLRSYDPFFGQKKESFDGSIDSIISVAGYTLRQLNRSSEISLPERKAELIKFLKLELWGNRRDLSVSGGAPNSQFGNPVELLDGLDQEILVDDTELVWNVLTESNSTGKPTLVDIVLDNSGYELFTDLCLASYLMVNNLADKIRFYVKQTPWFISDVTVRDFHWVIERMRQSSNADLAQLGDVFKRYSESGKWSIEEESYWTSPYPYSEMALRDPILYSKLSQADFIIFKGDLNYRKLVGDINWEYATTFRRALQGFSPSNFVSLRTVKAEVCVGLKPQEGETIARTNPRWMITGQYGLIQGLFDLDD